MVTAFRYEASDAGGRTQRGLLDAANAADARSQLRARALLPLTVIEAGPAAKPQNDGPGRFPRPAGRRKLKGKQLALITRQLATLQANGVQLEEALGIIARQARKPRTGALLSQVRTRVVEGRGLAEAMADQGDAFSAEYRASIAAGERSGDLGSVLERLADHIEAREENRQTVELALIYPALLALVASGIIALLLTYVVPDIVSVYRRRDTELPMLTQGLIAISDALAAFGPALLVGCLAAGLAARYAMTRLAVRQVWDRWMNRAPVIGSFSEKRSAAQFSSTLAMLTGSGVPLVQAMRISAQAVGNRYVRQQTEAAATEVSEGAPLDAALERAGCFPPMLLAMVGSGVRSGDLGDAMARAAKDQQRDLNAQVKTLVALVEPGVLLFMGAIVLLIVMAILTPIVNLNRMAGL